METPLRLVYDPFSLLASNPNAPILPKPTLSSSIKTTIVCAAHRRNRYGILESAYIIASDLRIIPDPVVSILREFGAGNGGRNGFLRGFGRGGSGGGRGRRRMSLGMVGILVILGAVGLWLVVGKELVLDSDTLLGGLGVVLFGFSAEGWRRGAKDWILGFFCGAFLVGLVSTKADFPALLRSPERLKKGGLRRKGRSFR